MKTLLVTYLLLFSTLSMAQNNDRRGFLGVISSAKTSSIVTESGEIDTEVSENVDIKFSARNITVGNEVYDIVTREFDGKKTNTFKCTMRRGTFNIVYITNESITIVDQADDELSIVYAPVSEK